MLTAIADGTLEPGDRLLDDELERWLGVSRTPIRQAIAELHTYGLVEIAANRFTKVATRDEAVYAEAKQFLAGLHALAREWSASRLDASTRESVLASLAAARTQLAAHSFEGPGALLDAQGELAKASGNAMLVSAEAPLRVRVNFLRPREVDAYDWDELISQGDELIEALKN